MAFEITLRSGAPPDKVLAAIRADLGEWRESKIPRHIWKDGGLRVVGEVTPPRFQIRLDRRWYAKPHQRLRLVGEVVPERTSGSWVHARVGRPGGAWSVLPFTLLLIWGLVRAGSVSWSIVVVAVIFVAIGVFRDRAVSRADPEAAYLAQRLEEAVARASVAIVAPPV